MFKPDLTQISGGIGATALAPEVGNAIAWLNAEKKLLTKLGVKPAVIDWILIQDYMESGAFTNAGTKQNNPGNIMWNKYDKYGTKGTYNAANKTFYSNYPTLENYLKKKIAVLSQSPGRPIDATSGHDFVTRLAQNRYFGKITPTNTVAAYEAAMKGAMIRINLLGNFAEDTQIQMKTSSEIEADKPFNPIEWAKDNPGKAALSLGLLILLFKHQ